MAAEPSREPSVTVTTVLYNSAGSLDRYARSLAPALAQGRLRVIVVDNATPDTSVTMVRQLLPDATVIANPSNLGFAAGCNRAWPLVTTRYWLLLNPDVQAEEGHIERLVGWMDHHPSIGIASPLLRHPGGRAIPVARSDDSLWRPFVEAVRLHKLVPEPWRSTWLLSGRRATPERISGWVPGAAIIARTQAVADVGLLNEQLFMYGEDREWCWRMRRAGWDIGVCPDAEFVHDAGTSARTTWNPRERASREVAGHLRATGLTHNRHWTRAFALIVGLTLAVESLDRRRDHATRAECRLRGRLYLASVRRRETDQAVIG